MFQPLQHAVLVVEDDAPLRELIAVTLQREGIGVVTARDGIEAIDRLARQRFRVVLLDLMMPRLNGWEVIDWLKNHEEARPHSLVVVSAADREVFHKLDPSLVNAIIVKPFDIYELAGYVRRCTALALQRDRRSKRVVGTA